MSISSVQSFSHVRLFVTPWTVACQASLSITNSQSLLKLMSIESVMPTNYLILCHPLLFLPSIFPTSGSFPMSQCPNNLSFRISPSNDYSGLISSVQGTLKSLLQHHSSKASLLQPSAFFMVQLSHPYMTTGKTISSVQSLSRVRLCDPMDCSRPGVPVHHQLPEFTQTHVH